MNVSLTLILSGTLALTGSLAQAQRFDYRLLATTRTSTMEKEMNQAADAGFVFGSVMGGETGMGGKEVVVVMTKAIDAPATKKTYKVSVRATTR